MTSFRPKLYANENRSEYFFLWLISKNKVKIPISGSFCLFLEIPLFYCLKTLENNENNIISYFFFAESKSTIIKYTVKVGVIIITIPHFVKDNILFEIFRKYI